MKETLELLSTVRNLAEQRGVFRAEAYVYVLEALGKAMDAQENPGHITGSELLQWIKDLGSERFGVMAPDVFNSWGVQSTLDFGRIVFHLVDGGFLRKRPEDSLSDFMDQYEFREAFGLKSLADRA